jgi:CheY-like chemotaxis protein
MMEAIGAQVGQFFERKRAEEEVREAYEEARAANHAKDEFLATLSHELRTPLSAIVGWTHMLRSGQLDSATAARAIETIDRNARVQTQLISDILDVSRIVSGKLHLDVRPIELASAITAALDTVRPSADAKGLTLVSSLEPAAMPVSADPDRLQQVVWNLVANAIKFTPRGGRVELRLRRVNTHAEIVIEDTGPGIPRSFLPHVFERFRQADGSSTRAHGGLGLGLAIVRHLVEAHGGTVHADSPGEGRGSVFTVRLPIMGQEPVASVVASEAPVETLARTMDLAGVRVLVVDDEDDTRDMVSAILKSQGAEVEVAASAAEAMAALPRARPHILVSDVEMPGQDGYELIRQVRRLAPEDGGKTPAAALTAYARPEDRMRALMAGFQIHVPKPVQPAELVAVVASLAGRTGPR